MNNIKKFKTNESLLVLNDGLKDTIENKIMETYSTNKFVLLGEIEYLKKSDQTTELYVDEVKTAVMLQFFTPHERFAEHNNNKQYIIYSIVGN